MAKSKKSMIIKISVIILAVLVTLSYIMSQKPKVPYAPFAISSSGLDLQVISPSDTMEGTPEGDLMIASPEGSKIFAKGGLNYVVAGEGHDEIYYSLCSTKIIDGKVNVIEGFDLKKDKLKIFCAHHKILPEEITIIHDKFAGDAITYVQIQGKHSVAAIALLGDIDLSINDIVLNERWHAHAHHEHADHQDKQK